MAFEINKSLEWIAKALGRSKKPGVSDRLPSFLEDGIRGTVDILGWERYLERKSSRIQGVVTAQFANGPVTPEGQLRLVVGAAVHHTDPITRVLKIELVETRGSDVPSGAAIGIAADGQTALSPDRALTLDRHVILAPGDFIRGGRNAGTFGAGTEAILTLMWLELDLGEYVPPSG